MIREKSLFLQDVLNTFDKNNKKYTTNYGIRF